MKSYTDIEQSKKLAEILPLEIIESADMDYIPVVNIDGEYSINVNVWDNEHIIEEGWIPCWSLAALLNIIPNSIYDNTDEYSQLEFSKTSVAYHDMNDGIKIGSIKDNLIDAAYEMIVKLHEHKLL